jgi:hypothetical protein
MDSKEKFDAIIYEVFGMDVLVGLGQHFGCPVIAYTTFGQTIWITQINGNPNTQSYVVNPFLSYAGQMTFYQRFKNEMFSIVEQLMLKLIYHPRQVIQIFQCKYS